MIVELCEHGETKPHWVESGASRFGALFNYPKCPGGRVLQQAIIIERDTDGNLPSGLYEAAAKEIGEIVFGLLRSKMRSEQVTSQLAGHWAGRILGAALASAQENQP